MTVTLPYSGAKNGGSARGAPPGILQILSNCEFGGAEKSTLLLTRILAARGCKCHVVSPPGAFSHRFEDLRALGVAYTVLDFRRSFLSSLLRLRRIIREENISLIHTHMYLADFFGFLGCLGNRKIIKVSTLHHSVPSPQTLSWSKRLFQRVSGFIAFRSFHRIFAVSDAVRLESEAYFRIPAGKTITVLNGIDFAGMAVNEDVRTRLAAQHGMDSGAYRILSVGYIGKMKSQITLIQALAGHLRDLKDIRVYMLGAGDQRAAWEAEVRLLGEEDRIRFVGVQENMNEWYSLADALVHPSLAEALSRSILEAMYHKLPVIASGIPSTREIIRDGETGLLFPPGDAAALARAIRRLYSDRAGAARYGEAARRFVLENCNLEAMGDALLAELPGRPFGSSAGGS